MPFHAFFGVIVMTQTTIIASQFYSYLDLPWMNDLRGDQYLGGESRGRRGSSRC